MLCISTSFWVLAAPEIWQKYTTDTEKERKKVRQRRNLQDTKNERDRAKERIRDIVKELETEKEKKRKQN